MVRPRWLAHLDRARNAAQPVPNGSVRYAATTSSPSQAPTPLPSRTPLPPVPLLPLPPLPLRPVPLPPPPLPPHPIPPHPIPLHPIPLHPIPLPPMPLPPARPGSPTKTEWRVVVTADRAYYERMRAAADPDAAVVAFPVYCPERRFVLTGTEVLIGRMSRSRGIEPGIDLTGPPEDAAVSHMHALLVVTPTGGWTIVDLDSANGTYLNDNIEQLAANQPVALSDGDQVHVGGWTTLTVRAG